MMRFATGGKVWFGMACMAFCGLAFSLTACDNDSVSNHAVVVPSGDSDENIAEWDSLSHINALNPESLLHCDRKLAVDGLIVKRYSPDGYSPDGYLYYKCENDEWSLVPANDVANKDSVIYLLYEPLGAPYNFQKCESDNEGVVDSSWHGNAKYGAMTYYRCEKGTWTSRDQWVTCDTAGVPVGAFCRKTDRVGFFNRLPWTSVYVYEGGGAWMHLLDFRANGDTNVYEGLSKMTKDCSSKNKWDKEKIVYGEETDDITLYYMCADSGWTEIDEAGYHCTTESTDVGDTCSFVSGDSTQHYIFMYTDYYQLRSYYGNIWVKSVVDPELGYCPQVAMEPKYAQKDGKFYYCNYGKWQMAGFVPHQETDSRKEGLTDEEYDVLDLPKEAEVGDRMGGLLEYCFYNVELGLGGPDEWRYETYDFCMPQNYYRYRDNGTWTLETEDDLKMNNAIPCTAGTEGVEYTLLPRPREPGRIYKRIGVRRDTIITPEQITQEEFYCDDALVDHIFGRYEKR